MQKQTSLRIFGNIKKNATSIQIWKFIWKAITNDNLRILKNLSDSIIAEKYNKNKKYIIKFILSLIGL